ncbi:hypothetical protein LCGC14_0663530 [marine sediment metagenome]|uniref:Uncharacterized protein n=1 Tax=marine sediment metagenome TaxID=412755 RepID=A0A0F9QSX6_9ZZZZ
MKTSKIIVLISVFSVIIFYSFLIPRTNAKEWIYERADTERISEFSV